jgi:hypothetical protein
MRLLPLGCSCSGFVTAAPHVATAATIRKATSGADAVRDMLTGGFWRPAPSVRAPPQPALERLDSCMLPLADAASCSNVDLLAALFCRDHITGRSVRDVGSKAVCDTASGRARVHIVTHSTSTATTSHLLQWARG